MSTRVKPTPKTRLKPAIDRARALTGPAVGDELEIRVLVTGRRTIQPSASVVARDVVTFRIPGYPAPVTVDLAKLIGDDT